MPPSGTARRRWPTSPRIANTAAGPSRSPKRRSGCAASLLNLAAVSAVETARVGTSMHAECDSTEAQLMCA